MSDTTGIDYFDNLREYQKETTANIDNIFNRENANRFAAVVLPTGGGKSFLAIQQILSINNENYQDLDRTGEINKTSMLYIAPNHEILSQIKLHIVKHVILSIPDLDKMSIDEIDEMIKKDFKGLNFQGINFGIKDEDRVFDESSANEKKNAILRHLSSSQITDLVQAAFPNLKFKCYAGVKESSDKSEEVTEEDIRNAEFIILDEAHRIGAEKWGENVEKLLEKNDTAKVLAITATPQRTDNQGKEMMSQIAKMIYKNETVLPDEYMAKEIFVLDAMRDGIVTSPETIDFDSSLAFSEQYEDVEKRYKKSSGTDKERLGKILDEMDKIIGFSPRSMTKKQLEAKRQENIGKTLAQNIKNPNGKYIAFIPSNFAKDGTEKPATEEYFKKKAKEIREQFKDVKDENGNPVKVTITYVTSDSEVQSQEENAQVLKDFEDSSSTSGGIKIVLSINKLNEGVHVDGIDGCIMYRNIGENSSTLYLQQSGRCISSMDPNKPLSKQSKTQIFDVAGNSFRQVNNRTGKKVSRSYDLGKIKEIAKWIEEHDGKIPDINSFAKEDATDEEKARAESEARLAIALKRLQTKYGTYRTGNVLTTDREKIEQILEIADSINLWEIKIPERELKPTEEELTGSKFLEFTPNQKKFMELYDEAVSISKGKSDDSKDRIAKLINILKILKLHKSDIDLPSGMMIKEFGKEIKSKKFTSISLDDILKQNFNQEEIDRILVELQDFDLLDAQNRREVYHVGEEYDLGKELAFVRGKLWTSENDFMENDGKSPFERYSFKQLISLGVIDTKSLDMFSDLYDLFGVNMNFADNNTGFMKNSDDISYSDRKFAKTPFGLIQEFEDCSLITGEKLVAGRDKYGFDQEGYDEFGYNKYGFNKKGIHRETGLRYDERGFYFEATSQKWLNMKTHTERDLLGYDINGLDENGFERPSGPIKDENGLYHYDPPLWHKRNEDGTYDRNGSVTIRQNCDDKGYDYHGFKNNGKSKFRIFEGVKGAYKNDDGFWSNGARVDKEPPFAKDDVYSKKGLDIDRYDEYGFKLVVINGETKHIHRDTSMEYDRKGRTYVLNEKRQEYVLRQVPPIANLKVFMRQFMRQNKSLEEIYKIYERSLGISAQDAEIKVKEMLKTAFDIYRTAPDAFKPSDDFEGFEFYFNDRGSSYKARKISQFFEICPSAKERFIQENKEIMRKLSILDSKKKLNSKEVKEKRELEDKKAMYSQMRLDER